LVVRVQHPAYILRPAPSSQISEQEKALRESFPQKPEEPQRSGALSRVQKSAAELQAEKKKAAGEAIPQQRVLADKGVEYKVEKAVPAPPMEQAIVQPESACMGISG
jgi:cytoskeletal protein RodZ